MIINKSKCKIAFTDILFLALSIIYLVGIKLWFPVCGVSGDMVMSCHWAGEVLSALSVLLIIISLIHMVIPDERIKAGIDISGAGIAVLSMIIPGNIITLCKNSEMPCRANTSLWTIIFMVIICVIICVDIFVYLQMQSGKKHRRNIAEK